MPTSDREHVAAAADSANTADTDTPLHQGIDPDVDLRVPDEREELRHTIRAAGVVAVGGMLGAAGRFAIGEAWPVPTGGVPWSTLVINLSGCFALGILMAYVADRESLHPLVRPFLGTGVIGGYTTFSTFAVEANLLLLERHPALGLAYLAVSVLLGVVAVLAGRAVAGACGLALSGQEARS
ncbi:camphor resistance protein CrcB [Nocardioides albertanoniae]|uniref:Fluoride-specific ion channel FluC n=1 Tax=Nocardioides albertanoniae TaxID=1175486 RepID=A0A543A1A5_9ACTN|nr:fluoride efflux transporter CrcB [Nocardioides albertanoniae]TQL66378.1 camphor resistance protein CrcB [Nocardioides albertanoniae]